MLGWYQKGNLNNKIVNSKAWRCIDWWRTENGAARWVIKLGSLYKWAERLTQHWPHKPHPDRHRGACVWMQCVLLSLSLCVQLCMWCESSTSDWISWTLAEHSQGNRGKSWMHYVTLKIWWTHYRDRQADSGSVTQILLNAPPCVI